MSYTDLYSRIGANYNVNTAVYRFAVISSVCGVSVPSDDIRKLDPTIYKTIIGNTMTEQKERLLFLFGADAIDEGLFSELLLSNNDFCDVLADAEDYLVEQARYIESEQISKTKFADILKCCITSFKYRTSDHISFQDALKASDMTRAVISAGYVKITDKDMMQYLIQQGEEFGYFTDNGEFKRCDDISENEVVQNGDISNAEYPFILNLSAAIMFDKLFDKAYGKEYIEYCRKRNEIMTESGYQTYVDEIQCTFQIKCYHRKRKICGEKVNIIDYMNNIKEMTYEPDAEDTIKLTNITDRKENVLIKYAMDAFKDKHPSQKGSIFEVTHIFDIKRYVYNGKDFTAVDESYNEMLFNFSELWAKLQENTKTHQIYSVNGQLQIPQPLLDLFDANEREYVKNIIIEQYARQVDKKVKSPVISSLASLKAAAKEEMERANEEKQQQEEAKRQKAQEAERKKAMRKSNSGVVEIAKNTSEE